MPELNDDELEEVMRSSKERDDQVLIAHLYARVAKLEAIIQSASEVAAENHKAYQARVAELEVALRDLICGIPSIRTANDPSRLAVVRAAKRLVK